MPWLLSATVLCVLYLAPQYGIFAQADTTTILPQSGLNRTSTTGGGRALNISTFSVGNGGNTVTEGSKSLDDLSLDDIPEVSSQPKNKNASLCQGKYAVGESFTNGCDERCKCLAEGRVVCEPRCQLPLIRKGLRVDPECEEKPSPDECCVIHTCTQSSDTAQGKGMCVHKNETFKHGEIFNDGCTAVCSCENDGRVDCRPRCPAGNTTVVAEGCVSVPDRADPCCMVVLCDVTLMDHDVTKTGNMESDDLRISSADAINSTAAIVHFVGEPMLDANLTAEASDDGDVWKVVGLEGAAVHGLKPGRTVRVRIVSGNRRSNSVVLTLPKEDLVSTVPPTMETADETDSVEFCNYKNHNYTIGQEFNDGCASFCVCTDDGVSCSPIECPSEFGLDVLDPTCLRWETQPRDFKPTPPNCCSDKVRCLDNGSCTFMGQNFPNWAEIPSNITGCEQKCYCELGNVTCQNVCPPHPPTPPADLPCSVSMAELKLYPGDSCCRFWVCPTNSESESGVMVQVMEPLDEHTVRLAFSVPPFLVGLHGRVEVRYTADQHRQDPSIWERQVLAPPGDLIATPQLHFDLGNLRPNTEYSIFIKVILRGYTNAIESPILTVRTLPSETTTLPPQIPVDPELTTTQVNSSWAAVQWRKFNEVEFQFIDGLQLRYREKDGKVFSATPLIHRSVTSYTLTELKPNTSYEVGMFFIPFQGQTTELQSDKKIHFSTSLENDPYKFEIQLDVVAVKSTGVEVTWTGVPYPEDKYVNIYRVIYQSETGKEDYNSFKIAKRDSTPKITVLDLKPTTRYRLWLEAYLTNGRTKKSNVQDFVTKPGGVQTAGHSHSGKLSGSTPLVEPGDYYGPLVAVAIIAALAIMAALILLLVLMRKHGQNKAPITARKTQSAYDNPSYKVEIQQETMDL